MRWLYHIAITLACSLLAFHTEAVEPRESGLNELVIFRPGTHERGLPGVIIQDAEADGSQIVDIPPTVHVHRFYYSGDKEYQGPLVQGGPTVVVATNPFTGERQYINVVLPDGAPVVAYNKSGITYVYPERRVRVRFSRFVKSKASVQYRSGQGVGRTSFDTVNRLQDRTRTAFESSKLWQSVKANTQDTGKVLLGTKDAADSLASELLDRLKSTTDVIPGVTALKGYAANRSQRLYDNIKRVAQRQKQNAELEFLPTNR